MEKMSFTEVPRAGQFFLEWHSQCFRGQGLRERSIVRSSGPAPSVSAR